LGNYIWWIWDRNDEAFDKTNIGFQIKWRDVILSLPNGEKIYDYLNG
jgi:hypothetical protein